MTAGQWRVFGLLLFALVLTAAVSPKAHTVYGDVVAGNWKAAGDDMAQQAYVLLAYALAFVVLVALADPAPGIATVFVLLLIMEELLANAGAIGGFINTATGQLPGKG